MNGLFRKWVPLRYLVRRRPSLHAGLYMAANLYYAAGAALKVGAPATRAHADPRGRVALCLRFRDEARYLAEWLDYHLAAGIDHVFLYDNFSRDDYRPVLAPYLESRRVTLIDWPRVPASPAAENDCIARTAGRFDWVGFIDADEFLVIADGRAVPDFLAGFPQACGVALHEYHFGSCGHELRPQGPVIQAYARRRARPGPYFKVFVRPDKVSRNRNPHNFYYRGGRCAVNELGRPVYGSVSEPPTAQTAWINHYFYKSLEDYLEKAARAPTHDRFGMRHPTRLAEWASLAMTLANDVADPAATDYLAARLAAAKKAGG